MTTPEVKKLQSINGNFYILLDQIIKQLTDIQNEQKQNIKDGAKIVNCTYGTVKESKPKERKGYSKADQATLDEYAQRIGISKIVTSTYTTIDTTANTTATNKAHKRVVELLETLENTDTKDIAKVASTVLDKIS